MYNDIRNLPTLKELEENLFRKLQGVFQEALILILEELDILLRDNRDYERFESRELQEFTMDTMFGAITINRRIYIDSEKRKRVALLDKYLQFSGSDGLSPFLTEMAVEWAIRGPSYRDARDRLNDFLGYQAMSHETIRQEVLKINSKETKSQEKGKPKDVDVLFLEVDGLFVSKQKSKRKNREIKIGVIHEGWEKRHPSSNEYVLKNKSYWKSLGNGEIFWEGFSRYIYNKYNISDDTQIVINGDGASWIQRGVDYFTNAIYTYDRYHLKKWIKQALRERTKKERRKAYLAADNNDPVALVAAIAEAQKAETDKEKIKEISALRKFVLRNQNALKDYRDILQQRNKNIDTSSMRPMGASESNMNLFSRRLKKMGYSWSFNGLKSMTNALIYHFEGKLLEAIREASKKVQSNEKASEKESVSFAKLLTDKTRKSIGAIKGHMPALSSSDQGKPYVKALRGLAGLR